MGLKLASSSLRIRVNLFSWDYNGYYKVRGGEMIFRMVIEMMVVFVQQGPELALVK